MTKAKPAAPRRLTRAPVASESNSVKLSVLEDFVGFHLRVAQEASFRTFAKNAGDHDLRPGRFAAMMVVHNNPGISQIALSRAIARDKSSVTPLVQDLARKGLLARRQSPVDRRSVTLTLTATGEARLEALLTGAIAHDRRLDAIIGDEKPALIRMLRKIADELG